VRVGQPPPLPPEEIVRRVRLLAGILLEEPDARDVADCLMTMDRDFVVRATGSDVVSGLVRQATLTVGELLDA
jgi:hypothetical protein